MFKQSHPLAPVLSFYPPFLLHVLGELLWYIGQRGDLAWAAWYHHDTDYPLETHTHTHSCWVSVVTFSLSATPDYEDKSLLQEKQLETAAMRLIQLAQPQIPALIILNPGLKRSFKNTLNPTQQSRMPI